MTITVIHTFEPGCVCKNVHRRDIHRDNCEIVIFEHMEFIVNTFLNHYPHIQACVVHDAQLQTVVDAITRRTLDELARTGVPLDIYDQRFPVDADSIFNAVGLGSPLADALSFVINSGVNAESRWVSDMQMLAMELYAEIYEGSDNYFTGPAVVPVIVTPAVAFPMPAPVI